MIDLFVLLTFVPLALALNLTPGADMMFCLAQGLRGGPRPALAAAAGVSMGGMVNASLAGLGLGALIASVPHLFDAIRWIGVAYLLVLAVRTLRRPLKLCDAPPIRVRRAFRDGFIINLTNPKVIFFILAFIPQFVDPARPVLPQFLIFGAVIGIGGFIVNGLVGSFAGGLGRALARDPRIDRALRWATGAVFAGLAIKLALEARRA